MAAVDAWSTLWDEFSRSLEAEGKSSNTLRTYGYGGEAFRAYLLGHELPADPERVTRGDVQGFLIELRDQGAKDSTLRARYSALRAFFNYLVAEEVVEASPLARISPPRVEEPPPEVLTEQETEALLNACRGKAFEDRRDMVLIRLLIDTGLRRTEVVSIAVEDVDLRNRQVAITRKGGVEGTVFYGALVGRDLDRYLRVRAKHYAADWTRPRGRGLVHPLFLAQKGFLSSDGVHHAITRRTKLAGIDRPVWPHLLRHGFGHAMKSAGISDENVMVLGGWRDSKSMRRYGASASLARAREEHRKHSPGDRF